MQKSRAKMTTQQGDSVEAVNNSTSRHRPLSFAWHCRLCTLLLLFFKSSTSVAQIMLPPDSPYYYVGCYTERADLPKELVYARTPHNCVEFCEQQSLNYAILSSENCYCSDILHQDQRQGEQFCNVRCLAHKALYCGGPGVHSYYATMHAKLPALNALKVVNATENSLTIAWDAYEPRKMFIAGAETTSSQQITNFNIIAEKVHTYSTATFFPLEFIVQSSETRFEITSLRPATEYNISVKAVCSNVICGSSSVLGTTEVGQPNPPPPQPRVLSRADTTITIEIPEITNNNGPITKVLVIVERLDDALSQPFDPELLSSWNEAEDNGLPYYIAAELDYDKTDGSGKRQFVVGDGRRYGRYQNALLDNAEESHYHISLGVVSSLNGVTKTLYTRSTHDQHRISIENFTYATFESGHESVIALVVTCVIFGTCLVLSVVTYLYLRFKTGQAGRVRRNAHEMTLQQPIIECENNGFVVENDLPANVESFKQQLNLLVDSLDVSKRLPRNSLRMNVNDIIADGHYGEVISGKLISSAAFSDANTDCQLHVIALDDLSRNDQAHLLQEFRNLTRLQQHEHIITFYGVSASTDWFYFIFEHQNVSLKRKLIESRRGPNSASVQRLTSLTEELILQWMYEIASACDYLSRAKVIHKQLCSHKIFVTAEMKLKVSIFGPIPYINNQKKVDISRWLAPETLRYQHFSTKSDVWSFACVAWECCTLGATPYANLTSSQLLLDAIKAGTRPAQPVFVFQDLYQLLLNCWQLEPTDRITFEDIAVSVRQLMTSPRHALCFDRVIEPPGTNVLDPLPYYLPMLEVVN